MSNIKISEEAYREFKGFLDDNKIKKYDLKLSYIGKNCGGPVFNISMGEKSYDDVVEEVQDIKFFIGKNLIEEYGGFIILSNNENDGKGLELKPINAPANACDICSGC